MNDFYEFDGNSNHKRGGFWRYTAVALIFFLIGALGMYYIVPRYLGAQVRHYSSSPKDSENPQADEVPEKESSDSMPALGAKGDLFIKSDNPVIEISEKVGPAVVGITNKSVIKGRDPFWGPMEREQEGYGSGIILSEDGYIATNSHVVDNAKELVVILKGGKEVQASLIGQDPMTDVAVIKVDEPDLAVAKIGDSNQVKQGELAIAIGNPLGHTLAGTITVGVVSAVDREIRYGQHEFTMIQTDAAINPGNSGGALVNAQGEIIGMNTLKTHAEGLGFAIPTNVFMPIVEELIKNGNIERPGIGVSIVEVNEDMIKEYGFPEGIVIVEINGEGAADKAGLLPNDVIIGIEDQRISTIEELKKIIGDHKIGDVLKFTIWRNEKEFVAPIKLQQLQG